MKNQKGITLVALVITIIVLLILAGVSISLVVGNNGVLTQASNAVIENTKAAAKQDIKMAVASCYADYSAAWAKNQSVEFDTYLTVEKIGAYLNGGTLTEVKANGEAPGENEEGVAFKYVFGSNNDYVYFKVDNSSGAVTFNDEVSNAEKFVTESSSPSENTFEEG